jgi:hypothetical protein
MDTLATHLRSANDYYERNVREWIITLLLLPSALYFCLSRGTYTALDHADLIIHEAGHVLFGLFGSSFEIAGGTLMQVALPLLLVLYFCRHVYRAGVQLALFWLAHNLLNISVYAADARAQNVPLLGGDTRLHDWNVILKQAGLLEYDTIVGNAIFLSSIVCFGLVMLLPALMWGDDQG